MDKWLQGFEYRLDITFGVFVLATAIVLLIALAAVSVQIVNSTRINPVKALRHE